MTAAEQHQTAEIEAVREALAQAIERMAEQFVDVGKSRKAS